MHKFSKQSIVCNHTTVHQKLLQRVVELMMKLNSVTCGRHDRLFMSFDLTFDNHHTSREVGGAFLVGFSSHKVCR